MAKHTQNESGRKSGRTVLAASFAVAGLAITGMGVYAGLNAQATNTTAESVASGTLSLVMGNETGSAGFGQTVADMAPGDVVNHYVNLTNGASLAAQNLTLGVAGTGSTLLTTSATKGLQVSVTSCSTAWTVVAGTASCPLGTTSTLLAATPVATLSSTPGSLVAGAVAKSAAYHLKVSLSLPDQNETTLNGTPVLGAATIQGLSTNLTYTFNEAQRAATTTEG
jgi:hypothetical protein